ncbi:DNA invertase Pin-like site-specific DNA recombinase [Acidovorax sp. 69]|uniref:recombinase family protein n=1 Tax=Acidovorax sp. 69 TaxID=2035202 RepID=UPI000C23E033|nr:recombinase family protein [Acidovorax sp. 69]PJI97926.1 DNA invertase Pin-like site-specific DNA recombinase [Acidovorax sp. 69]
MALIGYARVSTRDQETHLQLDALAKAGVTQIWQEKGSSVGPRPELQKLLAALQPGDVLVVYKMDRVARSLKDLLAILDRIKVAGAAIRSLTEPLDTSSPLGMFMIQILGAVAQLERSIIRERAIAGQVAARMRGVTWGGKPLVITELELDQIMAMYASGWYTWALLADMWGTTPKSIYRAMARRKKRANGPVLPPVLGPYLQAAPKSVQ